MKDPVAPLPLPSCGAREWPDLAAAAGEFGAILAVVILVGGIAYTVLDLIRLGIIRWPSW